MAKQTFTTGQVLTAAQVNSLQTNDFNQTVSAKTASYVLVAADKGTRIEFSTSGSVTCTVNTGLFDAGDTVYIQNTGAGVVTITAGTATVNTSASLTVNQYEGGVLYFVSASSAVWFEYASTATGDITGITTGATSGLTGGVTSGTADLKLNTAAKGDLLVGTGSGTVSALSVGANGTTLVADSSTATGLKWAAAAAGGKVLQVVQGYKSDTFSTTSTSFTDVTGLSVSITPSASTSKILIIGQVSIGNIAKDGSTPAATQVRLRRDTTTIFNGDAASTRNQGFSIVEHSDQIVNSPSSFIYLDSPATTSSTTYKVQILTNNASATTYVNRSFNDADSSLVLRTASSIIALEIGA